MKAEILKKDQVLVGNSGAYRVVRRLGLTGATARVFQIERESDRKNFALKLMLPDLTPERQKQFREEMVNLQRLRTAEEKCGRNHIPRIIESSDLQQPKTQELLQILGNPFIIMDLAEGTPVDNLLLDKRMLPEAEALEIAKQFAEVLEIIHREDLIYSDMKLGNLFWNAKQEHLTVIDWNGIAENKLNELAPWDRLRAASYLFRMVTGFSIPIECDPFGACTASQKYRREENFKKLTVGTRIFLIKAFHPDPASRHGNSRSQLDCTKEFLEELAAHAGRFKLSAKELMQKGKNALNDRQWLEAWVYLDLADRQSDIETEPNHSVQLKEDLEKAKNEAKKWERKAFFSGEGRYRNNLFVEALEDFEKAMRDDPYDEEARLFAVLTRFALEVKEETFLKSKEPLEECVRALVKGHLDLAENALSRLPEETRAGAAFSSLNAEIRIRDVVKKGRRLLKEDRLEEAQECFRGAYQQRDRILYVEPLEENLGSLTELFRKVEEIKKFYTEGNAYFEEERFHEAAWAFWKAHGISQGSQPLKKYQTASRFHTITKLLEKGYMERALEECNRTSGYFGDEPKYKVLYARVIDGRCEQLRQLTDQSCQNGDYNSAKEYIAELLKWRPEDEAAKVKQEDILKEIAGGYKEKIEQLDAAIKKDASLESCEQAIRFVEGQGYARFPEGAQFIEQTREIKEAIFLLSEELDDAAAEGDMEAQVRLLNRAAAKYWTLRQGNPAKLKKDLIPKIQERNINTIHTHLRFGRTAEALAMCENLRIAPLIKKRESEIQALVKCANVLSEYLKALEETRSRKTMFSPTGAESPLEMLKWQKDYLQIVLQIIELRPDLEFPEDVKQYEKNKATFLNDLKEFVAEARRKGNMCLQNHDTVACKKISFEIDEAIVLLQGFKDNVGEEAEKWKTWNREYGRLFTWLETGPRILNWPDDSHILIENWLEITGNGRIKEIISTLGTIDFDESVKVQLELDALRALSENSPLAFWLHQFLDRELKIHLIWKTLDENPSAAEILIEKDIESSSRASFEKALEIVKDVAHFLSGLQRHIGEPGAIGENPDEMLQRGKLLLSRLEEFPQLKAKLMVKHLQDQLTIFQRRILEMKKDSIERHSKKLEDLLKKVTETIDDHITRLQLEEEARQEIGKLAKVSPEDAQRYESRLDKILKELLQIALSNPSDEQLKLFYELQRRVCEQFRGKDQGDIETYLTLLKQDPHFKDVIPDYKRRHQNISYKLKKIKSDSHEERREALLALREEFGQFPEIDNALRETETEIFREKNREMFEKLNSEFKFAGRKEEWQRIDEALESIEPCLLNGSQQKLYPKMKTEARYQLTLRETLRREDILQFLTSGKNEAAEKWLKALEWDLMEKKGAIKPTAETLENIEQGEILWLDRGQLDFESLVALRRIKTFIQNIYNLNAKPTLQAGGIK